MMLGCFGEAPQKIRAQGARTPSPPLSTRDLDHEATSRSAYVLATSAASVSGGDEGRCAPQTRIFCVSTKRETRVSWLVGVEERNATQRGLGSTPPPSSGAAETGVPRGPLRGKANGGRGPMLREGGCCTRACQW